MSLAGGRAIRLAIAVSLAIQGTIAIVGTLSGGYFGAPVPYGDSGGITFDLLGGSFDFVWPIFLLDVTLASIPLYLCIRPLPSGWTGVLVALILLGAPMLSAAVLETAWAGDANGVNWTQVLVAGAVALLGGGILAAVGRARSDR